MAGRSESVHGNYASDSDQRENERGVRPRSSHHTRSNSVTFDSQDSPTRRTASPAYRQPTHYGRPPLSTSRASSSAALSPPKRLHSSLMNDATGDVARNPSTNRNDGSRRKRSSRKSGGKRDVRAIDYGLGLLDDPSLLGMWPCIHQALAA